MCNEEDYSYQSHAKLWHILSLCVYAPFFSGVELHNFAFFFKKTANFYLKKKRKERALLV